ncbi:alpha/beta fold hydrolase [Ruegeria profundi]|uniref:alpha/beta fold hydrolase n=1 Tax=Ruegeria profundi TaxID=1685378 RepID=UPI003C7D2298
MGEFKSSDGIRLHYEDSGAGVPLLCLAGLTRNGRDFSLLAPHVADARLITMDARGRGQSDHDPNHANYNVLRETQDVIELLDHLALDRVVVLGTSRGGMIAMMLATLQPDRLAGVILNDVGPVIEPSGIARIMDYVGVAPNSKTFDEAAAVLKAVTEPHFPDIPLEVWRIQAENQYQETPEGLALRYDPALRMALIEQAAAGPVPDLWPFFEALQGIPTGVLRGANSDILSQETLKQMQAHHPGLITAEIPDRGHVPFLDEPQSLTVIRKILDQA